MSGPLTAVDYGVFDTKYEGKTEALVARGLTYPQAADMAKRYSANTGSRYYVARWKDGKWQRV